MSLSLLLALPLFSDPAPPASPPALRLPRNHGPGTSGGGSNTSSGETLRTGRWSVDLRSDWTEFESFSRTEAEAIAESSGEFDALGSAWTNQLALAYGLTDDLELGLAFGYYSGSDFIDAEDEDLQNPDTAESASADPHGLTDTWVSAKWRVLRGAGGHLALMAGVKLPTGEDDERLSNGEPLEPSSQPGSGSVDYQAGVAYSRFLTPRVTLDASARYTLRTEHGGFEVGDRADLGLALAYRLTEDVKAPNNWSVFGELIGVWLDHDAADGVENESSGGEVLYLALGVRDRLTEHVALSLTPSLPVFQDTNGEQVEVDWRVGLGLSLTL
jgi:hypothetical protein